MVSESIIKHTYTYTHMSTHTYTLEHTVPHSPRAAGVGDERDSVLEESGAVCHLGNHVSMDITSSPSACLCQVRLI